MFIFAKLICVSFHWGSYKFNTNEYIKFLIVYNLCLHKCIVIDHWLIPWSGVLPEKLPGPQLVKQFPSIGCTRLYHYHIYKHLSLSWVRLIQSMPPHPTSWRYILLLLPHLCLGFPSGFFPSGFPIKTVYSCHLFPTRGTLLHPSHSSRFDHANNIWWGVQIMNLLHFFTPLLPCPS